MIQAELLLSSVRNSSCYSFHSQYLKRHPFQIIPGDQPVQDAVVVPLKAVVKTVFSVAMRVDDLFRLIFFGNRRKAAVAFHDIGGRVMQEHDKAAVAVFPGAFKGHAQPFRLAFDQVFGRLFRFLVPPCDLISSDIKRSFKSVAFCADNRVILVGSIVVLQKEQLSDPVLWAKFVDVFRSQPDAVNQGWRGEYWGKMMRGACYTYRALSAKTPDDELYAVLVRCVSQ